MKMRITFAILVAILLCLSAPTNISAQTCSWCQTVTDACCDGSGTSVDYTLPCLTTTIYVQYDVPQADKVFVEITDLTNNVILFSAYRACDCVKEKILSGLNLPANTVLRLKVSCDACNGNCEAANATVRFYTPSTNLCAPNCSPQ